MEAWGHATDDRIKHSATNDQENHKIGKLVKK